MIQTIRQGEDASYESGLEVQEFELKTHNSKSPEVSNDESQREIHKFKIMHPIQQTKMQEVCLSAHLNES